MILAYMPALYIVNAFANRTPAQPAFQRIACPYQNCGGTPGTSTGGPPWAGEIAFMLMTLAYLGVILFLTSRRSQVTRSALAIGTGTACCSAS